MHLSSPGHKVLLVGGKRTGLATLVAVLEDRDLKVVAAPAEKPKEIERAAVDADVVVLADDSLGDECVAVLRRIRATSGDLPVLLIGRSCRVDLAVQIINLGMVEYLSRPFDPRRLGDRIEDAIERRTCLAELSRRRTANAGGCVENRRDGCLP